MLQQTQALRVVPYYERWLAELPDVGSLASAPARLTCSRSGRAWATTGARCPCSERLCTCPSTAGRPISRVLPGVGPYTAAAVASFAWDVQVAAVDTNVRRVLTRRDGLARSPGELAAAAQALVPPGRAATFNQAMMELGATVCRPRNPVVSGLSGVARVCAGDRVAGEAHRRSALRGHRPLRPRPRRRRAAGRRGDPVLRRAPRARPRGSRTRRPDRPRRRMDTHACHEPASRRRQSYPERSWIAT